jgi:hypothetical protein
MKPQVAVGDGEVLPGVRLAGQIAKALRGGERELMRGAHPYLSGRPVASHPLVARYPPAEAVLLKALADTADLSRVPRRLLVYLGLAG